MKGLRRAFRRLKRHRGLLVALVAAEVAMALSVGLSGKGVAQTAPVLPANDLNGLAALPGFPTPTPAPLQNNPQPELKPVPPAQCGHDSRPLVGVQGRVPASAIDSPEAAQGWTCNLKLVGSYDGTPGGFRTWRYVDSQGQVCAFYDSSLPSPLNVVRLGAGPGPGAVVLDMSNPARPTPTALLSDVPMRFPHESLNLNARRGLIAAEMGNGTTLPGLMSIYDVSRDCRHPVLDSTFRASRFGHESGFALDGKTFWIAGGEGIAAVDLTDPKNPHTLWEGNVYAHGLNLSDDGNRLYDSDPINGNLVILDVSQVQARKPNPVVREISRLIWDPVSVPQNTNPMLINGHPYLLEFDEFGFRFTTISPPDTVGAARIIDIAREERPRVVSNIRLAVNMKAEHAAADGDPSPLGASQFTYSAHYCNIPREVEPEIAACSFINSGLRVFNIQDPDHPREIAYYISPPKPKSGSSTQAGDFAMSQPTFDPVHRQVWYTDATSGFYALKLDDSVWPHPTSIPPRRCAAATGRLAGSSLGPVALGRTRSAMRRALTRFTTAGSVDSHCVFGGDIRVGYPSSKLLRSLSRSERKRVTGRAILALTANKLYSLRGVRPGTRVASVARRLGLGTGIKIGANTWYVLPGAGANGVLRVRGGVIRDVGVVDRGLTGTLRRARALLASFG